MGVEAATACVAAAKAAYKADKSKENKKALKEAKVALVAAEAKALAKAAKKSKKDKKRKAEEIAPEPVKEKAKKSKKAKKEVVDIAALEGLVKSTKSAYKADKTAENKAAMKSAKAALATAVAGNTTEAPPALEETVSLKSNNAKAEEPAEDSAADSAANPTQCDKIFCGNLSFQIDEDSIKDFFKDCGTINEVRWLEDKEDGRFKGCGFLTFDHYDMATKAVALAGSDCMGREIRIDFCLPREGDTRKKKDNGSSKFAGKPLSEKPDGCTTVFAGNLSFEIDDDAIYAFAEGCGDIKQVRWLNDRETGNFKGCGFIEFFNSEDVDKFVAKNGEMVMGRPIRLDYSGK